MARPFKQMQFLVLEAIELQIHCPESSRKQSLRHTNRSTFGTLIGQKSFGLYF